MNVILYGSFDLLKYKLADVASQLDETKTGYIHWGRKLKQTKPGHCLPFQKQTSPWPDPSLSSLEEVYHME